MKQLQRPLGYGRQSIDDDDRQAVLDVLNSDFLTQGPAVEGFENDLAERLGVKHVIAVANGTAALHIACLAAGLKSNDVAVTSTMTFVATANAPIYCGAKSYLLDIDPTHGGMSETALSEFLTTHPECKVVLPIHFAGAPGDMKAVRKIAGDRIVIEDACHALGGCYDNGQAIGSCCYSDMTVFSFHPVKPITTGEGGAVTTNDDELARRLRMLRNHGIERDKDRFTASDGSEIGPWSYEQQMLGYNYRMCDLQAALGRSQLKKLDGFLRRRKEIAALYDAHFKNVPHITPFQSSPDLRSTSGMHIYVVQIDFKAISMTREQVMLALKNNGVGTQVHYIPVHHHPFHMDQGHIDCTVFPIADGHYSNFLSIPLFPAMSDQDVAYVCEQISAIATTRA